MRLEEMINILMNVSDNYAKCDPAKTPSLHYETLHSALLLVLQDFTEEQFMSVAEPVRITFNKLEEGIYRWTSPQYKASVQVNDKENGRFYVPQSKKVDNKRYNFTVAGFGGELPQEDTTEVKEEGTTV